MKPRASPLLKPFVAWLMVGVAQAQKTPDVRLDVGSAPGAAQSYYPRLVCSGTQVFAVWEDYRISPGQSKDVYFNRSLDGGATWLSSDTRLNVGVAPGTIDLDFPEMACSGSSVYVVWEDKRTSSQYDLYFNRSLDSGSTWLATDLRVDHGNATATYAQKIAASGSTVYVTWMDNRLRSDRMKIYFERSLDSGATWLSTDVRLDSGATSANMRNPQIALSGSGVYVVWQGATTGSPNQDILFNRSLDGGTTWLPAQVRLDTGGSPGASDSSDAQVATSGSSVYVCWVDDRNGSADIYFNRSLDQGTTWLPADVRLDVGRPAGSALSYTPRIQASGSSVHVVWSDSRNGSCPLCGGSWDGHDIYFNRSLDGGTTWLPADVRLDLGDPPGASASLPPALATSGSTVHVAWADSRSGIPGAIYLNRSLDQGTSWLPTDVRIDTGGTSAVRVGQEIVASGSSVYVCWQDDRNGSNNPDIYFNLASGAQPYGQGLAGSGGVVPEIAASGDVAIGGSLTLTVSGVLGGAVGRLGYGFLGPASIPLRGGTLLVQPPFLKETLSFGGTPGTPGAGSAARTFAIPNDLTLLGTRVNVQAGAFDAGAVQGVSMTAGLELWTL